ncbi:MAG: protein-export chaperone SecB [Betaproteobacteria bacterium]
MTQQEAPVFAIEKVYVKGVSLEVPNAPAIFLENQTPDIDIQLETNTQRLGEDVYEVALTVTVTTTLPEKTVFLIEVVQAGIFRVRNVPEENLEPLLSIACPNILFPYVREVVSDVVSRAGFSPVILQPVNFEVLYASRQQQQQEAAEAEKKEATIQ